MSFFDFLVCSPVQEGDGSLQAYLSIVFGMNLAFVVFGKIRQFFYDWFEAKYLTRITHALDGLRKSESFKTHLHGIQEILKKIEATKSQKWELRIRITLKCLCLLFSPAALFLLLLFGMGPKCGWLQPEYWHLWFYLLLATPIPTYVLWRLLASWHTRDVLKDCEEALEQQIGLSEDAVERSIEKVLRSLSK